MMLSDGIELYPEPPDLTTTSIIVPLITTGSNIAPEPLLNVNSGCLLSPIISLLPYPTPLSDIVTEVI